MAIKTIAICSDSKKIPTYTYFVSSSYGFCLDDCNSWNTIELRLMDAPDAKEKSKKVKPEDLIASDDLVKD